jgi:hypothetical protein
MDRLNLLLSSPPPSFLWLGVGISLFTIFLQVALAIAKAFGYRAARQDRRRDQHLKMEERWLDAVVIERALPAILEFLDTERTQFRHLSTTLPFREINDGFSQRIELLKRKLVIVSVLSESSHRILLRSLDSLTDIITSYCAANDGYAERYAEYKSVESVIDSFYDYQAKCMNILRDMHMEIIHTPPGFMRRWATLLTRKCLALVRAN